VIPRESAKCASREERFVLAIDLGTSALKVGVVSLVGQIAWQRQSRLTTRREGDECVLQDAEEWWQNVADSTRRALAESSIISEQIVAVCVTGQWSSTVPVDSRGRTVGECIMWMDSRGAPFVREVMGSSSGGMSPDAADLWRSHTGAGPSMDGNGAFGHLMYLQHSSSEVSRAARWYLEPVDYLSMRFTGVAAASTASMMGSWLLDSRHPEINAYDPELLKRSGIAVEKLPPLSRLGSIIGTVQDSIAREIGLDVGTPVMTGMPDLHSAVVGSGAVGDYEPYIAISTSSWISCSVREREPTARSLATVPGLSIDRYLILNNQDNAGRCLEWLRDNILAPDDGVAPGIDGIDYDDLFELAGRAEPGSGNVIFTPWLSGERVPISDRHARGGFHNLTLSTSRSDLIRSVLEGVAYNSRLLFEEVERFANRRLEPIRLVGGCARSPLWCQIVADVLDRRIEQVADPLNASIRGAALFTAMSLGEVARDEVRSLVEVNEHFVPNPANRRLYDRLYTEFPRLHVAQREMFSRLSANL
jgi:xylulokinase